MVAAEATLREWLLNMGRKPAAAQMANLFCELRLRLHCVGLVKDNAFEFPLTQMELADVLGLSAVHANRTLQQLRAAELIIFSSSHLHILDLPGLEELAEFDLGCLHLQRRGP